MTSIANDACARFLDDLAAVVDGDGEALARHVDHLAGCDDCRDARHEAAAAATRIGAAGGDFVVPPDLEERVLRALGPAVVTGAPRPVLVQRAPSSRRVRPAWLVTGGLGAAAVVAVVAVVGGEDPLLPASPDSPGWSGSLAVIDRAAAGEGGVEVRTGDRFAPVRVGATLSAGAAIRTDDSTRVELAMRDGSRITLDHGTELRVDGGGRVMTIARGNLVADVAPLERGPAALFHTPAGRVEVLGTRFALSATGARASVRVVRGAVRLASPTGVVEVRAGEEGVVARGEAPEVAAAGDLVGAIGWSSELLAPDEPAGELPAGIGELRAFKPGEKRDRDWKLTLSRHKVTVRIAGNVARTEIEETFQNDSATALEGVYSFPLPPDARIERLALDVEGKMEEGAFVAKARAAAIWRGVIRNATSRPPVARRDEIIWVPGPWRDPALLEWQQGGRFELRIFPIPRRGSRTIQLAYTQILEPQGRERRYVYPLPHRSGTTPAAGAFDLDVRLSGIDPGSEPRVRNYAVDRRADGDAIHLSMSATGFRPRGDLVVEYALPDSGAELRAWSFAGAAAAAPSLAASRRGGADPAVVAAQQQIAADSRATALIALRPRLPRWTESRQRDYLLVVDSSQSMVGERFARARTLATALVAEMDRRDRFALLACDVDCRSFAASVQAPSAAAARRVGDWLAEVQPAGASDLVASLTQASGLAEHGRETWILYIGDGAATTGYRRLADLRAEAAALSERARVAISTVGIGGDADVSALGAVARAGGGFFTPYVPGQRAELAALSVLETTFGVALERPVVELPAGLEDSSPAELPTLRAGQELLIAARMSGEVKGDVILRGTVGGKPYENRFPLALAPSESRGNAFVPRVWAALTIERMELDGRGEDQARIVAMSQAYGVLSRHTSLLVLESPAMFRAFGVDRSRPQVSWTGDEAAEGVESSGAVDLDARSTRLSGVLGSVQGEADDGAAPAARPAASAEPVDLHGGDKAEKAAEKAPSMPARRRDRIWIPMRREWFRVGSIRAFDGVSPAILDAVARAEAALAGQPDSRERHRALVQALSYAGDLDRAFQMASRWLERDRLDPEALAAMADLLGRQGRRADAVRLLSGVVDLSPEDRALHARLAAAYDRIGATAKACSHRIALASLAPADAALVSGALRCQRAIGLADGAGRLLRATDDKLRAAVETKAAQPETRERTTGELILDASWGGADLDLSLVTPDGRRVSWLGGRGGLGVVGAGEAGRERLALRRIPAGHYLVELSRTDPADRAPATGVVTLRAIGATQSLPFSMSGERVVIGRITVSRRSRLVPVDPMLIPR